MAKKGSFTYVMIFIIFCGLPQKGGMSRIHLSIICPEDFFYKKGFIFTFLLLLLFFGKLSIFLTKTRGIDFSENKEVKYVLEI